MRKTHSKEVQNAVNSSWGSVAHQKEDQSQYCDYKSRAQECECSVFRLDNLQSGPGMNPITTKRNWSPGWNLLYKSPFPLLWKISIELLWAISDGTLELLKDVWRHSCRASLHASLPSGWKYLLPQDPTTVTGWQQVL